MTLQHIGTNLRRASRSKTISVFCFTATAFACSDGALGPVGPETDPPLASPRIQVINDAADLAHRVRVVEGRSLPILAVPGTVSQMPGAPSRMPEAPPSLTLVLRAEVDPPDLGGLTIQATEVDLDRGIAYVSYNVQGPVYRGGVDAFDVRHVATPLLLSQALFEDTDVSSLDQHGGYLYLATATGDPAFTSPAVLEAVALDGIRLTAISRRVDLPSYAATGVTVVGDQVLVTSGNTDEGGLSILDRGSLERETLIPFRDARDVVVQGNIAIAMKGTPAELYVVERTAGTVLRFYSPGGANIPESKSTIKIFRNFVFVAAGDEGTKLVRLSDGAVVATLPTPQVEGLPPEYAVTNAVSAHGNLLFMANGGAGLYVAQIVVNETGTDAALELVGRVDFGDDSSANYVAAKGNVLFVASGLGGLKIVEIANGAPTIVEEE